MERDRSAIHPAKVIFGFWLGLFLALPADSSAAVPTWVNPKEAIGPSLARFQQGKKKLTPLEKEEIQKYGYTGLELMTYVDSNRETRGKPDFSVYHLCVNVTGRGGNIREGGILQKYKFYYPSYAARLKQEGIKPGDAEYRVISLLTSPAETKGDTSMRTYYLPTSGNRKDSDNWSYSKKTRKVTRSVATDRQDEQGSMHTSRDRRRRGGPGGPPLARPSVEGPGPLGEDVLSSGPGRDEGYSPHRPAAGAPQAGRGLRLQGVRPPGPQPHYA